MAKTILSNQSGEFYSNVLLGSDTILRRATKLETLRDAQELMRRLETDDYLQFLLQYYEAGLENFGDDWVYADIVTVLLSAASLCKPSTYLEIGVRRGRSVAAVVTRCPEVSVFAFDMWAENYANIANPGPEFVKAEMAKLGYQKAITFVDGNSHKTLPAFFEAHPDLELDMITVDGDHTENGALQDLRDVLPHLALGGVIVFDDVVHPLHPYLLDVWNQAINEDGGVRAQVYTDLGYGIAVGVRQRAPLPRETASATTNVGENSSALSTARRKVRDLLR